MLVDLLAIGGAHIDRTAQTLDAHIAGASNPARVSEAVGGGAFNALRNAKMLNAGKHGMMSVRGGDGAGQIVENAIDDAEIIDLSGTFMDRQTPTYTVILDTSGELVTAFADMSLYEDGFDRQVKRLEGRTEIAAAKHILLDANLPGSAIKSVLDHATGPVYAMCISPAKAQRLLPIIDQFEVLFLNRRELTSLTIDAEIDVQLATLEEKGVKRAVITNGPEQVVVFDAGITSNLWVPKQDSIVDVTGAGDSLTGATIASMMSNPSMALSDAVTYGIAAAQMTLQVSGPVCDAIGTSAFDAIHKGVIAAQRT